MKGCSVVLERLPEYGQKSEDQQSDPEEDDDSIKDEIEMEEDEREVETEIEGEKEEQVTDEQATAEQASEEQPMEEKSINISLIATSRLHQDNADEPNTDPLIMDVQMEDKPVPDSSPGLGQRVEIINQVVLQPPSDTPPTAYMTDKDGYATLNDLNFFEDPFNCMGASDNAVPPYSMEIEIPKGCYGPKVQSQTQPVEMNQHSNGAESDSSVTLVPNAPAEVITISDSDSSSAATNNTNEISHVKSWHVLMMKSEK